MHVKTVFGMPLPENSVATPDSDSPFRILVIGDFGSDNSWGSPVKVDRDNLDRVLQRCNVRVRPTGSMGFSGVEIPLASMEDFHPDRLYERLELFASMRERRDRLEDDSTFAEEAEAILAARGKPESGKLTSTSSPPATGIEVGDLFDQMLDQTETSQRSVVDQIATGSLNIDELVRQTIAPHLVDSADPRQAEFIAGVDSAIAETMRRLLHHPAYQHVEAAWLGVKMLIRRLETGPDLQIHLLNVSKSQLAEDVSSNDDLSRSRLYKLLFDATTVAGSDPWTVVIGNFTFDASPSDTEMLGRIAQIHSSAGAVFVAGALPAVVGCSDLAATPDPHDWSSPRGDAADHWQALRALSAAASIALTLPRILARNPYGASSDPIDSFKFEEIPDGTVHRNYLWMNAAFVVATILGRSFSQAGWSLNSAWAPALEDLPVYFYDDNGESVLKPCGEVELVLRAGEVLSDAGLTPVHSVRDQGSVLVPSLRSLSSSQKPVAGAWE